MANTYRKYLIIRDLQEKFEEYASSENYYMKSSAAWGDDGEYSITKCYVKGDKIFELKESSDSQGNESTQEIYQNGEKYNIYYEYGNIKQVEINVEGMAPIASIYNFLESESNLETFKAALWADIEKTECNEKECYLISNYVTSFTIGGSETTEIFVEMETGLCIETCIDDRTTEYSYEFNNVDDDIFNEPDVSEYTIIEYVE